MVGITPILLGFDMLAENLSVKEGSYGGGEEGARVCQFLGLEEAGVPGENHWPATGY